MPSLWKRLDVGPKAQKLDGPALPSTWLCGLRQTRLLANSIWSDFKINRNLVLQTSQVDLIGLQYIFRRNKEVHVACDPKEPTTLVCIRGYDDSLDPFLEVDLESFGRAKQQLLK